MVGMFTDINRWQAATLYLTAVRALRAAKLASLAAHPKASWLPLHQQLPAAALWGPSHPGHHCRRVLRPWHLHLLCSPEMPWPLQESDTCQRHRGTVCQVQKAGLNRAPAMICRLSRQCYLAPQASKQADHLSKLANPTTAMYTKTVSV